MLIAIRENEQRAQFIGYPTDRYKLIAFTLSATITGLAGCLLLFNNRMTSAEPISVAFSGELLAMVVIGGMRSFLGPALGALFFVIFRDYLSSLTANWLLWFGLLFVGFRPVLADVALSGSQSASSRPSARRSSRPRRWPSRKIGDTPLPEFLKPVQAVDGPVLQVDSVVKHFGGIKAVDGAGFSVRDRTLHALIGPNGAGKTTAFNLVFGNVSRRMPARSCSPARDIAGLSPDQICRAGIGRSFQITNLFPTLTIAENIRLARAGAPPAALQCVGAGARSIDRDRGGNDGPDRLSRAEWHRDALKPAHFPTAASGSSTWGWRSSTKPRLLLLDEPLAGLATAERERIGGLVKALSADVPVLLVEHDIDRVFRLADHVTVMNEGKVLLDGTVEDARTSKRVQEVYIGSGSAHVASKERVSAAEHQASAHRRNINTFYGKSHILSDVSLEVREHEVVALLGRNGAGKSTLLKSLVGIAPPATGSIKLDGTEIARLPSARAARLGIGYVPQGRGLFAGMTVAHNLELGRLKRQTGIGVRWDQDRILEYFPRIRDRLQTPADFLSGGEQQMVAVARALSGDIRVLLLDEPFEGLAPAVVEQLFESFDRLRKEVAIVIVDHHLDLALGAIGSDGGVGAWRGAMDGRVQSSPRRSRTATQSSLALSVAKSILMGLPSSHVHAPDRSGPAARILREHEVGVASVTAFDSNCGPPRRPRRGSARCP